MLFKCKLTTEIIKNGYFFCCLSTQFQSKPFARVDNGLFEHGTCMGSYQALINNHKAKASAALLRKCPCSLHPSRVSAEIIPSVLLCVRMATDTKTTTLGAYNRTPS